MEIAPDVLGVRPEGEGVQVEVGSVVVLALEGVGDSQVDPHSHVVGADVEGPVVELDGLVGPAEVGEGGSDLVHEEVVGGVEVEGAVEEVDGHLVLPLDEEEDGECRLDRGRVTSSSGSLGLILAASSNTLISCSLTCFISCTL